jgi:hypothetical protein
MVRGNESDSGSMKRLIAAFLIGPLWVPLPAVVLACFMADWRSLLGFAGVGAALAYAGAFLLGLPAFLYLRRIGRVGPGAASGLGFIVGIIMWNVFTGGLSMLVDGCGFTCAVRTVSQNFSDPRGLLVMLGPAIVGSLVGVTVWWILRPLLSPPR